MGEIAYICVSKDGLDAEVSVCDIAKCGDALTLHFALLQNTAL